EPAVGALQEAGKNVLPQDSPYLYSMLTDRSHVLVWVIAFSVGLAGALGVLRFIHGWSLKPLIYWSLLPTLGLTCFAHVHPELRKIVGLAWDCGGAVAGPVTVPLVLALGIGVSTAVGRGISTLSGFGIVTLASLFPVAGVLLYATYLVSSVPPGS